MVHERYKIYGGIARAVFAKDKFLILRFNELEGASKGVKLDDVCTALYTPEYAG